MIPRPRQIASGGREVGGGASRCAGRYWNTSRRGELDSKAADVKSQLVQQETCLRVGRLRGSKIIDRTLISVEVLGQPAQISVRLLSKAPTQRAPLAATKYQNAAGGILLSLFA